MIWIFTCVFIYSSYGFGTFYFYIQLVIKLLYFKKLISFYSSSKKGKKEKPPKQGSTRLPKFPVVDFSSSKENATKCFPYSEVPKFR